MVLPCETSSCTCARLSNQQRSWVTEKTSQCGGGIQNKPAVRTPRQLPCQLFSETSPRLCHCARIRRWRRWQLRCTGPPSSLLARQLRGMLWRQICDRCGCCFTCCRIGCGSGRATMLDLHGVVMLCRGIPGRRSLPCRSCRLRTMRSLQVQPATQSVRSRVPRLRQRVRVLRERTSAALSCLRCAFARSRTPARVFLRRGACGAAAGAAAAASVSSLMPTSRHFTPNENEFRFSVWSTVSAAPWLRRSIAGHSSRRALLTLSFYSAKAPAPHAWSASKTGELARDKSRKRQRTLANLRELNRLSQILAAGGLVEGRQDRRIHQCASLRGDDACFCAILLTSTCNMPAVRPAIRH